MISLLEAAVCSAVQELRWWRVHNGRRADSSDFSAVGDKSTTRLRWLTNERTDRLFFFSPDGRTYGLCSTAVLGDDCLGEGIDCSPATAAQNNKPSPAVRPAGAYWISVSWSLSASLVSSREASCNASSWLQSVVTFRTTSPVYVRSTLLST